MTDAKARYAVVRREAHTLGEAAVHDEAVRLGQPVLKRVRFTSIDAVALGRWRGEWRDHPDRRFDWDWEDRRRKFESKLDRFEVAIWVDDELCGLCLGRPSKGKENLSVYLVEGSPKPGHPLKGNVLLSALEAAHTYASALDCKELRLIQPLPEVLDRYLALGFVVATPTPNVPYCWKAVAW